MQGSSALGRSPELAGRYRTLLEINNAIASSLRRGELLHAICEALRPVLPFDRAALNIYEPETDLLRLLALETGHESQIVVGSTLNRKDSASGWVFDNQRPLLRRNLMDEATRLAMGYGSFRSAWRTLQGIEAVHMIRKGRVRRVEQSDAAGQAKFIGKLFGIVK